VESAIVALDQATSTSHRAEYMKFIRECGNRNTKMGDVVKTKYTNDRLDLFRLWLQHGVGARSVEKT
jgi:hypothetical protein